MDNLKMSDDRLGYIDTNDLMYSVDDFGNLILVPFCLNYPYFQEH
jgi:hypothetical protein